VLCLLLVTLIWVGASEAAQYLFVELAAPAPILMTYVNTVEFVFLLPLAAGVERARGAASDWRAAARAAAAVAPLWFVAQASFNAALTRTTVGSATALSATSAAFTFGLHVACGGGGGARAALGATAAGVALTLLGAALVGAADEARAGGGALAPALGDALALASAAAYALYSRAIAAALPAGGRVSTLVFFGFVGAWTALFAAPVAAAVAALGVEDARALARSPRLPELAAVVLLKGLFDNVLSDVLWARAIVLTSPTLATVGLSLTIPLALLADLVARGQAPGALGAAGAALVFTGFVVTAVGEGRA
jgi:solute carrier family 35 protein F5